LKEPRGLRILNLEDDPLDAELIEANLAEGGVVCQIVRVWTRAGFAAALEKGGFDLVLGDYVLPAFDGAEALEMAREARPELPFILVSGTLGEEVAIDALKSGATDYVLKHRLSRLVPAVRRAVSEARARKEREEAQEALRRSEQRFRRLVEQASDAIFVHDLRGRFVDVNRRACESLGYSREQLLAMSMTDIEMGHDHGALRELWTRISSGAHSTLDGVHRRRDGTTFPVEVRVGVFESEGSRLMLALARDVTERKRAEKTLKESEERFKLLVDEALEGIALSEKGVILDVSERFCEMFGYESDEVVGMPLTDFVESEDQGVIARRNSSGGMKTYEARGIRKDGTVFPLEVRPKKIPYRGRQVYVSSLLDLTERYRAQDALKQSEQLYRTVVEQAAENIFLIDIETRRILEANAALHNSLGYTREELRRATLYDIVAHDKESIDRDIQRILEDGRLFTGERSYRRKDGASLDMESNVSTVPYGDGQALCIVAHDITERKQAEENLRRSLSVLLALLEAGQMLGSTLESEEVVSRLLEIMQRVLNLTAAVICTPHEDGRMRVWRSTGIERLPPGIRYTPEAEAASWAALENSEQQLFWLRHKEAGRLAGLCLPLRTPERDIGVLQVFGGESLAENDAADILGSLASQAVSALENARLYGELAEREHRLQDLLEKLLGAQEEERRRVAYEVHDELAQVAAAAHQHLQAFFRRYPPQTNDSRKDLERVLRLVRQTVSDARKLIANLRPTALDDFGLAAAVSLEVERLREEGYRVDHEENLGDQRLPAAVEITLFRVMQEALTNMRKHTDTRSVRVGLRRDGDEAHLEVRDYGSGFDPSAEPAGTGPGERIGLAGMRERVGMLGGKLEVHSQMGSGTSVTATAPLLEPNPGTRPLTDPR